MTGPHLLADISFHGFGHLAQTAPVLNALRRRVPGLRLTVRSGAPRPLLASRIEGPFDHIPQATDFGMRMESALAVRVEESARAYAVFHRDWEQKVERGAKRLAGLAPDLVFANVSYLALAEAARAGIPAAAMCSLNWADIYRHYCRDYPGAAEIHRQMLEAYNSAACFLRLQPGMPMADLRRAEPLGTVARRGADRRAEIDARLDLEPGDKLVLVALGGIPTRLPLEDWPRLPGVRWLVEDAWQVRHPDAVSLEALSLHFVDLLCSCDALITKPGYGSFAEAAANGVPVLYVPRRDWPEEPWLVDWLRTHGRCREIPADDLAQGRLGQTLEELVAMPAGVPVPADGADRTAAILVPYLGR